VFEHWLVEPLQQPPLHSTEPPQEPEHAWFAWQAWYIGQSSEVAHPHWPCTQWFEPLQGPQAAPMVPHCVSLSWVTQFPFASQHPAAQLEGVHFAVHAPPLHACEAAQASQAPPPVPQYAEDSSEWHAPSAPQHPPAQLVGVHGTAGMAEPVEPSSEASLGSPPPASSDPLVLESA
jgi:hypothetical protein